MMRLGQSVKVFGYVLLFAGRHNTRELDTIDQMAFLAEGMVGKKLPYKELVS